MVTVEGRLLGLALVSPGVPVIGIEEFCPLGLAERPRCPGSYIGIFSVGCLHSSNIP